MEQQVEYDAAYLKQKGQQLAANYTAPASLSGSVAAIVGNMCAATQGFDVRNLDDVKAAQRAFEQLMQPWFEAVLKAQATIGRDKVA